MAVTDLLERLYKIYSGEMKVETASYRDISNYFIKLPPKDTAPPALSHDNSIDDSKDSDSDSDTTESSSSSSEESTDVELVRHPRQQRRRRCCLFESSSDSSLDPS